MLEKMGQIKPRDLWQVMNWSKCFHICKNCLFPPACHVICAACVPSAGEIHFRRLYCLFLKMSNICIRHLRCLIHHQLPLSKSISPPKTDRYGIVLSVADTVVRGGHCGCECSSSQGQIKQSPLSFSTVIAFCLSELEM